MSRGVEKDQAPEPRLSRIKATTLDLWVFQMQGFLFYFMSSYFTVSLWSITGFGVRIPVWFWSWVFSFSFLPPLLWGFLIWSCFLSPPLIDLNFTCAPSFCVHVLLHVCCPLLQNPAQPVTGSLPDPSNPASSRPDPDCSFSKSLFVLSGSLDPSPCLFCV